jgi:branched-chain amino acid transport system substrate-binding protein
MLRRTSCVLHLSIVVLLVGCRLSSPPPFACADAIGCVKVAPADPIRLGVLQVLSGDLERLGHRNLRSVELALDALGGELLGHPIELITEDSLCSKEGGRMAAAKIVANPQIVGVIGPTCSGAAASAMEVLSSAGLVMVAGSCSAPSLTSVNGEPGTDWHPGFFRTAQNDALSGRAAATFAFQVLGVTEAATVDDGDPYTGGLGDSFEQAFTELGGQIVLVATVNKGDTDMRPVLTAVARSGADLVYLPLFEQEGIHFVEQAQQVEGMESVTLMSAEGLYQATFFDAAGQAAIGLHLLIPATPGGPAHDEFVSRYLARYGESPEPPYYAHTYDAASLLLTAIEAAAVRDEEGALYIGRQALRDVLYATAGFEGLTGSLTCDEYGDCGVARFQVVRFDDPAAGLEGLAADPVYTYPPGP